MAFKQAKDIEIGDVVLDRGETFTVKEIRIHRTTRQIGFFDTEGNFHGWYVPEEYLGVIVSQRESLAGPIKVHIMARINIRARDVLTTALLLLGARRQRFGEKLVESM
jgi:hypothetical protein